MALRRTIAHLVESGCLDCNVVNEWREAAEAAKKSAVNPLRARALERAPIGTRVTLNVLLAARQESAAETEPILDGALCDMRVNLHASNQASGGGLFGSPGLTQGRLLIPDLTLGTAVQSLEANERSVESTESIKSILQCSPPLTSGPMAEGMLLATVFPQSVVSSSHALRAESNACLTETCLAVEHVVRRLASIDNGLPPSVQAEWHILDKELQSRRRRSKLAALQRLLPRTSWKTTCVVKAVDDKGCFTLAFPSLKASPALADNDAVPTVQVPTDFIGQGGVVVDPNGPHQQPAGANLFGAAPAISQAHGGGFGRPSGLLFGNTSSAASQNDTERISVVPPSGITVTDFSSDSETSDL